MRRKSIRILAAAGACMTLMLAEPQKESSAAAQLQAAINKENVEADLAAAIKQYGAIVAKYAKSDRAVAAKALVRMAECHQKLGDKEAQAIYQRVLREYSDQSEPVTQARARLAAAGGPSAGGPRAKLLWDGAKGFSGTVTADGRFMSAPDFSTGNVVIKDLVSGAERRITSNESQAKAEGLAETSAISPDGRRVAYAWDTWDAVSVKERKYYQVRVIGADGNAERTLWRGGYAEVFAWSTDGKWIAAAVTSGATRDDPWQLALFAPDSGEQRILRTKGQRQKAHAFFSPDGKWLVYDESVFAGDPPSVFILPADGSAAEGEIARDAQVIGWSPDGSSVLFSRERGSESALFLVSVSGGKVSGDARPLYTAANVGTPLGVTQDGRLFYRWGNERADGWLAGLNLRTGRLSQPSAQFAADKIQLRMNDNPLKFSPDGRQLVWVTPPNRVLIRTVAGDRQVTVTPRMKEVRRAEWSHDGAGLLIGGTGVDGRNGLYRVDPASGAATFITSTLDLDWHVAFVPSRDGQTIYYGTPAGKVAAYSLASGTERIIFDDFGKVPNISLSRDGKTLAIRSGPKLGVLDLTTLQYKRLYTREAGEEHVMWGLDWSADDRDVVVIARDYAGKSYLWIFPADGGPARRQPLDAIVRGISISPDGKTAATVRIDVHQQVWSLENFLPARK